VRGHPAAIALRLLVLGTPRSGIDAPVASVPITREDFLLQLSAAREGAPIEPLPTEPPEPDAGTGPLLTPIPRSGRGTGPRAAVRRPAPVATSVPDGDAQTQVGGTALSALDDLSPPREVLAPSIEETTQQTVIPGWMRTSPVEQEPAASPEEVATLRAELAQSRDALQEARSMISVPRAQAREAEAALRHQAAAKPQSFEALPGAGEGDAQALEALRAEVERATEDARGARRSLGRAVTQRRELEAELEQARAELAQLKAGGVGGEDGEAGTEPSAALAEEVRELREALEEVEQRARFDQEILQKALETAEARLAAFSDPEQETSSLQAELAAAREAQAALAAEKASLET